MKKIILSCLAIVAIASTIKAQTPQVQVGAAKTYSVTAVSGSVDPNAYTWSISAAGAATGFAASTTSTQNITWTNATLGVVITVTPKATVAAGGCNGIPSTFTIDVVTTLPYTVSQQTASAPVCPAIAGIAGSGDVPTPVLQISNFVAGDTWSVTYTIDAVATSYTTTTHNAANGFTPAIDNASKMQNITAADVNHVIHINSWTVNGTPIVPSGPVNISYTVHPAPTVSGISSN